jgi:hypothetical protein
VEPSDGAISWVELVGGPYDGQMVQLTRTTIRFRDGRVLESRGVFVSESGGHYAEDGMADESLGVVRMVWKHDPAGSAA